MTIWVDESKLHDCNSPDAMESLFVKSRGRKFLNLTHNEFGESESEIEALASGFHVDEDSE